MSDTSEDDKPMPEPQHCSGDDTKIEDGSNLTRDNTVQRESVIHHIYKIESQEGDRNPESSQQRVVDWRDFYRKPAISGRKRSMDLREELDRQGASVFSRSSTERRHSFGEADLSSFGISEMNESSLTRQGSESCKDLYIGEGSPQGQTSLLCAQFKDMSLNDHMKEKEKERETRETCPGVVSDRVPSHRLKWIYWHGRKTPIVTQNENGPCPLIAIANILFLRGVIKLPPDFSVIPASQLLEFIGETILESMPKDLPGVSLLNYEQNMHDAIAILPHLNTGLNVNVKFTGVRDFEYTPECIIFDLLNIPLYHGWLVDPQCHETVIALGNLGYNQVVERIVVNKCSDDSELVTEALIAEQFLEGNATQLTYHGLCELNIAMRHDELAVLFRNNHFSTILKKKHELFQLVTDLGFLNESRVVWETLNNIEGDGQFVDGHFTTIPPASSDSTFVPAADVSQGQQIDHDYLVALSLQEDQKKEQNKEQAWEEFKQTLPGAQDITSDEELARRIQEDEQQHTPNPPAQAQASRHSSSLSSQLIGDRNKKGVCTVL